MSVEIIHDSAQEVAVLFCNTSGQAFGPAFQATGRPEFLDADERAVQFLAWLAPRDARDLSESELVAKKAEWEALGIPESCGARSDPFKLRPSYCSGWVYGRSGVQDPAAVKYLGAEKARVFCHSSCLTDAAEDYADRQAQKASA